MAKRRKSSGLALPWESQGTWIRDLFFGHRARYLPWIALTLIVVYAVASRALHREQVLETRDTIARVHRGIAAFRVDFGRCPSSMRELVHPPRTGVRYLDEEPRDAWGRALWVRCPARYGPEGEDVVSAGPSGSFLDDDNVW